MPTMSSCKPLTTTVYSILQFPYFSSFPKPSSIPHLSIFFSIFFFLTFDLFYILWPTALRPYGHLHTNWAKPCIKMCLLIRWSTVQQLSSNQSQTKTQFSSTLWLFLETKLVCCMATTSYEVTEVWTKSRLWVFHSVMLQMPFTMKRFYVNSTKLWLTLQWLWLGCVQRVRFTHDSWWMITG